MVSLKTHPRPEQHALLAACATSSPKQPAPAERPRAVAAARLGGRPGISAEVLSDLRAADDALYAELTAARAKLLVPLHRPSAPIPALLAEAERVKGSRNAACRARFEEDRVRRERIAAASWVDDAAATVMTECAAEVLDAVAARPWVRDDAALRMSLAPIVSWLKLTQPLPVTDWTERLAAAFAAEVSAR